LGQRIDNAEKEETQHEEMENNAELQRQFVIVAQE
jgi:hypothetical protein